MKSMRKVLSLMLALLMVFSLCACEKDTKEEAPKESIPAEDTPSDSKPALNRLKKVTITTQGQSFECNVTWKENECSFTYYTSYSRNISTEYQGMYDPEKKEFSVIWVSDEGTTTQLPVFQYDDDQKIIRVYNEDNPTESWEVTYDEHNIPTIDGRVWLNYDPETKQIKQMCGSGHNEGIQYENYKVTTLDDNGHCIGVDMLTYEQDDNGEFQLTSRQDDYQKYTYDENGNLIRYEEPYNEDGFVIEYEYYDEPISHLWELLIPISYIDFFNIYTIPFLWYLS